MNWPDVVTDRPAVFWVAVLALVLGLLATAFVVVVALMIVVPGILFGLLLASGCGESLGPVIASNDPENGYIAQIRSRDCGATSSWNTRVVLSEQHSFDVDRTPQSTEIALGGVNPRDVKVEWTGDRELTITSTNPFADPSPEEIVYWGSVEVLIVIMPDPVRPAS